METITMWAEMSSLATDAQRKVAPDINVRNAIQSTDIANIRKILKTHQEPNHCALVIVPLSAAELRCSGTLAVCCV